MTTRNLHPRLSTSNIGGNLDLGALQRLTGHWDDRPDMRPRRCKKCNRDSAELRRCASNDGIAWQCRACGAALSAWLPRAELAGVNIADLAAWQRPRRHTPQGNLFDNEARE